MASEKQAMSGDVLHAETGWREEEWGTDRKLSQAAENRAHTEHRMTVQEAIHAYPMAIFWCLVISTCVIMEGTFLAQTSSSESTDCLLKTGWSVH